MSDHDVLAKTSALARGNWPYPVHWIKRRLRTRHPRSFTEKLQYKMIRDRRPLVTTFADKVAVRDYVAGTVGEEYLTDLYAVADDPVNLPWADFPSEYVCKVSHGCGGVIVVWDGADSERRLSGDPRDEQWAHVVIRPENVDFQAMCQVLNSMLAEVYGWGWGTQYEWAYRNVPPRVLVEERLHGSAGDLPADYRVFVFNGQCRMIQVDTDWLTTERTRDFFLPDWSRLDVASALPHSAQPPSPPQHLRTMIRVAEALAAPTDFLRVDFFDLGERLVVGELTNYPVGGTGKWSPVTFDHTIGSWWEVPRSYRHMPSASIAL